MMMLEKVIEIIIDQTCAPASIHTSYIISFIIYLLEDEQELSLGMLIRLQRIYNLWSIHANILSFLDVLRSFYSNFISFFGPNLLT